MIRRPPRSTLFPLHDALPIFDVATLTGAVVVALGKITSGIFGAPNDWVERVRAVADRAGDRDRKSTRLNSSHQIISYAAFCLKKTQRRDKSMSCASSCLCSRS